MQLQTDERESKRALATRQALQDALLTLLDKLPISKITISMICEKAEVHRSTFYLYYQDVYQLRDKIQDALYDELHAAIEDSGEIIASTDILVRVYRVVYKNRKLCRVLFGSHGDMDFLRKVASINRDALIREWKKMAVGSDPRMFEYMYTFGAITHIGIMERWVATGFVETPEKLAQMVSCFLLYGLSSFLPLPPKGMSPCADD